jgi:hypothetical protein
LWLNFTPILLLFLLFLHWGYIVTFIKVLIMYYSWIHLLHHSPLSSSSLLYTSRRRMNKESSQFRADLFILKLSDSYRFFLGRVWLTGLELRAYSLSHSISPFFVCDGFFRDRVLITICLGWLQAAILLISASWIARITGMSTSIQLWYRFWKRSRIDRWGDSSTPAQDL